MAVKKLKKDLKVAIVHDFLVKMGGAEKVAQRLMEMFPEAPIYTLLYDWKKCGEAFPAQRVRTSFLQNLPGFIKRRYRYLLSWMPQAMEQMNLMEYDLVISSSSAFAHGVLTNSESLHVCYCHSPMRYAWDYTHNYLGEQKEGGLKKWLAKRYLHKIRQWDLIAADRADFYVANSEHVAKRIKKFYRLPAVVIYPPVDVDKFDLGRESKDYFLIVSTLTPYKKIDLAVSLFNKLGKKLVVIGGGEQEKYLRSIAGPTVEIMGRQSDAVVKKYLEECRAFIFPSEEDFGIGMVEAMACGKPVLAFGQGGALETIKAGFSGEFFKEQTLEAMEDALGRLIVNLPKYDRTAIRKEALKYSALRFEKEMMDFVAQKWEENQKRLEQRD